jgi:hypothetical protein
VLRSIFIRDFAVTAFVARPAARGKPEGRPTNAMPSIASIALLAVALGLFATADAQSSECHNCQLPCHCVRMRTGQICECPAPPPPTTNVTTFTEKVCKSGKCESCTPITFATNKCISTNDGGSAIAECGRSELTQRYYNSADCGGDYHTESIALNQCMQDTTGGYFEVTCGRSFADAAATAADVKLHRVRAV